MSITLMEGNGKVSVSSVHSNQRETEVSVGRALTAFIVDHIDQGRMERNRKVSGSSVYSNQRETEVTVGRALTGFIVDHIDQHRMED